MSVLNISEYRSLARDLSGYTISAGAEPAAARQNLDYFAAAVSSLPFLNETKLIRIIADADSRIEFGVSPTATQDSLLISAGGVEYFGVIKGHSLSVIENI